MNVLITGGSGFIGSYLCEALKALGHRIRIVDVASPMRQDPEVEFRKLNILERNGMIRAMDGIDIVFHLAAKHRFFGVTEAEFFLNNEEGTKSVLESMDEHGVGKIIFFSSVAVYGDAIGPTEEGTDTKTDTAYGRSKLAAERWIRKWAENDERRSAVVVRPTVVFGPHNKGNIYRLIRQILWRAYLPVGNGENIKSIACVENVVSASTFLMERQLTGFHVFNYADSPHMPFSEIVKLIYETLGRENPQYRLPEKPMHAIAAIVDRLLKVGGIQFSFYTAILKTGKTTYHRADKIIELGFSPSMSSREGILRMVRWQTKRSDNRAPEGSEESTHVK